jgi:hypothetical protein
VCTDGTTWFIIDWSAGAVTDRPTHLPRYEVSFYATDARMQNRPETEHLAYVVFYEYDPITSQGYVYLPGPGEQWYPLNVSTMLRRQEGRWLRATPAWQRLVVPLIARR